MTTIEARISSLEAEFSTIKIQMKSQFKDLDAQKADLLDQLNVEFTKTKMGLTEVVEHAKVEFVKIRSDLQAIYGNAAAAFDGYPRSTRTMVMDGGSGRMTCWTSWTARTWGCAAS